MFHTSWLTRSRHARPQGANNRPRPAFRPGVETLEGRDLMAATLAISDVTLYEPSGGGPLASFTVTLSEPSAQTVTVKYQNANGTATAGKDYLAASGTLTFAPGETSKTVPVEIIGDQKNEPDETFFVNLSGAVNADILDGQGLGTILNDDGTVGDHGGGPHCKIYPCG